VKVFQQGFLRVKDKIRGKCLFWTNVVWSDFAEIQI